MYMYSHTIIFIWITIILNDVKTIRLNFAFLNVLVRQFSLFTKYHTYMYLYNLGVPTVKYSENISVIFIV